MPTQNIDLGNTSDVQFNGNRVDFLYLDSTLIWSRVTVTLSLIDAFGPEIQVSASNLTSGDKWQYKVDSGSWQTGGNFPTIGSNHTVSQNLNLTTGGTKNIQVRVLNSANIVLATSNTIQVNVQVGTSIVTESGDSILTESGEYLIME